MSITSIYYFYLLLLFYSQFYSQFYGQFNGQFNDVVTTPRPVEGL